MDAFSTRPNLIYVWADQLRARALGYMGDTQARTPNLDAFAAESINLRNAVASSPVCTAYRASLFTGKYTTSHGMVINELRMNPNQRCWGHALTEAGYRTGYIGKWHLWANVLGHHDDPSNSFVPRGPHRLGFDGMWKAYNFHHENYGTYYHEESPEKIFYGPGVYEPEAQTEFALDFVRDAAQGSKPFALFLSWGPPHDPWGPDNVPARFWELYAGESFPNPPNYKPDNDAPYADAWARLSDANRAQLEAWRRGYYAQTASVDECFGRLLAGVEAAGVADKTLIVFTSDHGELFGAQGRRAKNIFYEEACHIPFLVRGPGIAAGTVSDACFSTVDVFPTFGALMGLDIPNDVEGSDLAHVLRGEVGPEPDAALMQICGATAAWEDGHEWRALRDKQYTYAIYRVDGKEFLFDRQADPYQMRNLATEPEYAAVRDGFRARLRELMAILSDNFESCTWYRDHWTDGDRNIIRSATQDFTVPGDGN